MIFHLFREPQNIPPVQFSGKRVYLRPPEGRDAREWVDLRVRNAAYLAPVSPRASLKDLTEKGYARRLDCYRQDWKDDRSYAFFVFLEKTGQMIGGVTINGVVRGAGQMALLGYWMDEGESGKGLMTEAVDLACGFAFRDLKLHRLQAGCLPRNAASRRVLEKCGFHEEGIARQYINIDGRWQDHVIYARVVTDGIFFRASSSV